MWTYQEVSVWLAPPIRGRAEPWLTPARSLRWRETGDAYYVEGALPGFRRKDLTIEAKGRELEIRAEREHGLWRPERRTYREVFPLPDGADATAIHARFEKGELSIRIAKLASARRRHIPIRVNGRAQPPTLDVEVSPEPRETLGRRLRRRIRELFEGGERGEGATP